MTEDITLRETINTADYQGLEPRDALETAAQHSAGHSPFADEPDAMSDFFEGGDRIEQMNEAIHLSQFGNNIALISGDTGSGKTFFLEQASYELSETASCCFIRASIELTNEDIAKEVSTELSMPFATHQTIEQLIDMLDDADALQDVSRFIIIVDDIHLLTEDIIFSLLHLSQLSNNVFHLLASGLPSTLNFLESLDFQEGIIKEIYLFPYGLEDTRDYLNFKMKAAGYEGDEFFDPETVTTLYRESAGYPTRINQATERYLLSQEDELSEEKPSERSLGLPLWHMVGLVFLLFALILAFFYRGSDEPVETEQTLPIALENNTTEPASLEVLEPTATTDSTQDPQTPAAEQTEPLVAAATEQTAQAPIETPIDEAAAQSSAASSIDDPIDIIDNSQSGVGEVIADVTENAANPEQTIEELLEEPTAILTEAPIAENQTAPTEQTQASSTTPANNISPEASTAAAAAPNEAAPSAAYSADEQIVLDWPENDSTVQIIGALDKASLEQYVAAQVNKESLRLVTILRDDKPWHIVVADHYPNNNQARQAIQRLPQNQVNAGPWIRKVTDLKQGIRAFKR